MPPSGPSLRSQNLRIVSHHTGGWGYGKTVSASPTHCSEFFFPAFIEYVGVAQLVFGVWPHGSRACDVCSPRVLGSTASTTAWFGEQDMYLQWLQGYWGPWWCLQVQQPGTRAGSRGARAGAMCTLNRGAAAGPCVVAGPGADVHIVFGARAGSKGRGPAGTPKLSVCPSLAAGCHHRRWQQWKPLIGVKGEPCRYTAEGLAAGEGGGASQ